MSNTTANSSYPEPLSPEWFQMPDLRRRRFGNAVWVPLRTSEKIYSVGEYGKLGNAEEIIAANSIAFPLDKRDQAERLGWSNLGLMHEAKPFAYSNGSYKPADIYQYRDGEDLGIELVFPQSFPGEAEYVWHLSLDLVLALRLKREGDVWVRPEEAYIEVVKLRRDKRGDPIAMEIRSEHLRDYLAARGMALRIAYYRQRRAIVPSLKPYPWGDDLPEEDRPHDRFQISSCPVDGDGWMSGSFAIFKISRTDPVEDDDVPTLPPETDENTTGESWHGERPANAHQIEGELWREEWIEPATHSERVRGDDPTETNYYATGASGERMSQEQLADEDIGRWLWFRPDVIPAILKLRNSGIEWHTRETGSVWAFPGYRVHFGVNSIGLVTVYAYDVAILPAWQQRIWVGANTAPEGKVSPELLAAQVRATPSDTNAPETDLIIAMEELDAAVFETTGYGLFREHQQTNTITNSVHRFRSSDEASLHALAKDLVRLIADRISTTGLEQIIDRPSGENWGSLKWLEKAISTKIEPPAARELMSPLFGIYEMRLADAHLQSAEQSAAIDSLGLDSTKPFVIQGEHLLDAIAKTLRAIGTTLRSE